MNRIVLLLVCLLPLSGQAASVYVSDSITVNMLAGPDKKEPLVKNVATGAALEVLERINGFARVRDATGTEGWVDESYLTNEKPSLLLLGAARDELNRAKAQLVSLKQELDSTRDKLTAAERNLNQEKAKTTEMTGSLSEKKAELDRLAQVQAEQDVTEEQATVTPEGGSFGWLTLLLALAMLGIGFTSGIIWLREHNRRKLGGRYLRV